jgi:hypothetical protein
MQVVTEQREALEWSERYRKVTEDPQLTRAAALALVQQAAEHPSATPERLAELRRRSNARFGAEQSKPLPVQKWGGKGFREDDDDPSEERYR